MTEKRQAFQSQDTSMRLAEACLSLWCTTPSEEISYRSLARSAGTAVSAIDYHFGSLERLYGRTQVLALERAEDWLEKILSQLQPLASTDLSSGQQAAILSQIIDDWCEEQRPLAMAALQACVAARRSASGGATPASHSAWIALWQGGWRRIASTLGLPDLADLLLAFHHGTAPQHLLRSNRVLDRALLDEDFRLLLGCDGEPAAPVRQACRHFAGETQTLAFGLHPAAAKGNTKREEQGAALDAAAAHLLRVRGIDALTFRAVAAEAGCTLGQTGWHFGSRSDLLQRAFARLYHELAVKTLPSTQVTPTAVLNGTITAVTGAHHPVIGAVDEIILHVSRSQNHAALRGPIRIFTDPTAHWAMQTLCGRADPQIMAQTPIFSALCRGLNQLAVGATPDSREELAARARSVIGDWLARHCQPD